MTCRAPRAGICGAGSTLSEYEVYFNYARTKYPETVQLRPLMWANGPAPGMQFWPPVDQPEIQSDGPKSHWVGHRQNESKEYISYLKLAIYIYIYISKISCSSFYVYTYLLISPIYVIRLPYSPYSLFSPLIVPRAIVRQTEADRLQGYDFVAYHGYGKRRYFELVGRK